MIAFCNSYKCTGNMHGLKPVEKEVSIHKDICPDCGCYLMISRSRKKLRHYAKSKPEHTKDEIGRRVYDWR